MVCIRLFVCRYFNTLLYKIHRASFSLVLGFSTTRQDFLKVIRAIEGVTVFIIRSINSIKVVFYYKMANYNLQTPSSP
jgi:hypothetical protein